MGTHIHVYYMESYIHMFGAIPVELKVSLHWRITNVASLQNLNYVLLHGNSQILGPLVLLLLKL
jgi:hypothetical protein